MQTLPSAFKGDPESRQNPQRNGVVPLWLFNTAIENCPFIDAKKDDLPTESGGFPLRKP